MESNWYVIHVPSRKEELVCQRIKEFIDEDLYYECFVPLVEKIVRKEGETKKLVRPLFTGYLFMVSDRIEDVFIALKKVPFFTRVLEAEFDFIPMKYKEVEGFIGFLDQERIMSKSVGFIEGNQIYVTKGPLKGQEGKIRRIDRHKQVAYIDMIFMGRAITLHVPLEIVEKI